MEHVSLQCSPELSFHSLKEAMRQVGKKYSPTDFLSFVNPAISKETILLLSDQCEHTTKIGVFTDCSNTVLEDKKEYDGSILKQFRDALAFLLYYRNSGFNGSPENANQSYPEGAIREALLNALVHRDYSYSGSIIINVNQWRMEFISIGGLPPCRTIGEIQNVIAKARNKELAEVFHSLGLIENNGTGIQRIYKFYEDCLSKPAIETTANTFKLILPNKSEVKTGMF